MARGASLGLVGAALLGLLAPGEGAAQTQRAGDEDRGEAGAGAGAEAGAGSTPWPESVVGPEARVGGEARGERVVRADEARGAAAQDLVPPPPPDVALRPMEVRFTLAGAASGEVLYLADPVLDGGEAGPLVVRRAPTSAYALLCAPPCQAHLPHSHFGLALRVDDAVHRFAEPLGVNGPTRVDLALHDRAAARLAGGLLLAIGVPVAVLGGALAVGVGVAEGEAGLWAGGLAAAGATLGISLGAGVALLLHEDEASFEVVPLPAADPGVLSDRF